MSTTNKIIILSALLLLITIVGAGWMAISQCKGKGLWLCIAGAMVPDEATQIITSEKCKEKYGASAFQDPNGLCYQCPEGHDERTIEPVTTERACKIPGFERISRASFVHATSCQKSSPGSFFDPAEGGQCWSCPEGYSRTIYPVTSGKACEKLVSDSATRHERHTPFKCPNGQFYDPKGYCYSCDSGLNRTIFDVDSDKACEGLQYSKASFVRDAELKICDKGSFFDPRQGGECWSCPDGYNRTLTAVTSNSACSKVVTSKAEKRDKFDLFGNRCEKKGEFWDPQGAPGPSYCYTCNGLNRTLAPIGHNDACQGIKYSKANYIRKAKVEICPGNSFLDPRKGGQCWSCPSGFSRTLDAVTADTACVKKVVKAAVRHKEHIPLQCPSGQFYDLNGYCYSCNGLKRTIFPVDSGQACQQLKQTKATFQGPGGPLSCKDGSFFDLRNGGECWKCPDGYNRSAAAVDAENACSRSNALDTVRAIELGEP